MEGHFKRENRKRVLEKERLYPYEERMLSVQTIMKTIPSLNYLYSRLKESSGD